MIGNHNSGGGGEKRRTVGDRLGSVVTAGTLPPQQQNRQQQQDVQQLNQLTQMLKQHCGLQQQRQEAGGVGGASGGVGGAWRRDREVLFNPPWETKIGQLQQVVRAIHRNAEMLLDNRGAVILRCYPSGSSTYMELVYHLIYTILSSTTHSQFGPMEAPNEIRPILLNYNNQGMGIPNPPTVVAPHTASLAPQFAMQHQWTDFVLIRVHFTNTDPALWFTQYFNRISGSVFDRRQVRPPFAHPDLTRPERMLRNHLQNLCNDKNAGSGANARPPPQFNRISGNRQQFYYNSAIPRQVQNPYAARYYHNGIQLYKEFPNGRTETVPWEPFSEAQYLHVLVASLRKYASMYKQKECYVIIQNIAEDTESEEADRERITAAVYTVVSTEAYRQRCANVKNAIDQRVNRNSTVVAAQPQQKQQSPLSGNSHLPLRIERMPRRAPRVATAAATATTNAANKEEKKKDDGQKKEEKKEGDKATDEERRGSSGDVNNSEIAAQQKKPPQQRDPLVRVQFRTIEAAIAFCQMFKECQLQQQRMQQEQQRDDGSSSPPTTTDGEEDTDSYSDLSELDVFSAGDGQSHGGSMQQLEEVELEPGTGKSTPSGDDRGKKATTSKEAKKSGDKKKDKKKNKKKKQQRKQRLHFFPDAFAHRDLTPPELALGYALRQYCREKNGKPTTAAMATASSSSTTATAAPTTMTSGGGGRFYTRAGRIFERSAN